MELKHFLLLSAWVAVGLCQYDVKLAINQTKNLQDIEKYGVNYTSLYPPLGNLSNVITPRLNDSSPKNSSHHHDNNLNQPFNSTQSFLNKTMSNMPKGVCVKEVP